MTSQNMCTSAYFKIVLFGLIITIIGGSLMISAQRHHLDPPLSPSSNNNNDDNDAANKKHDMYLRRLKASIHANRGKEGVKEDDLVHGHSMHKLEGDALKAHPLVGGFHVEYYHSKDLKKHSRHFDLAQVLSQHIGNDDAVRCEFDSTYKFFNLTVNLLSSSSSSSSSTNPKKQNNELLLDHFSGASFDHADPELLHNYKSSSSPSTATYVPFHISRNWCKQPADENGHIASSRTTVVQDLVALHAEIASSSSSASSLVIVARAAILHEKFAPGTRGGVVMTPLHPNAFVANDRNRNKKSPSGDGDSATTLLKREGQALSGWNGDAEIKITSPLTNHHLVTGSSVDVTFEVNGCTGSVTSARVEIVQCYSMWSSFSSCPLIIKSSLANPKVDRYQTITLPHSSKFNFDYYTYLYVFASCDWSEKATYESYDILNPANPGDSVVISKPVPHSVIESSNTAVAFSMYVNSKPSRYNMDVWLISEGWSGLPTSRSLIHTFSGVDLRSSNPTKYLDFSKVNFPKLTSKTTQYWLMLSDCSSLWHLNSNSGALAINIALFRGCPTSDYFYVPARESVTLTGVEKTIIDASCTSCSDVGTAFCTLCGKVDTFSATLVSKTNSGSFYIEVGEYHWSKSGQYAISVQSTANLDQQFSANLEVKYTLTTSIPSGLPGVSFSKNIVNLGNLAFAADPSKIYVSIDGSVEGSADLTFPKITAQGTIRRSNFLPLKGSAVSPSLSCDKPLIRVEGLALVTIRIGPIVNLGAEFGSYYIKAKAEMYAQTDLVAQYPALAADSSSAESNCQSPHWLEVRNPTAGIVVSPTQVNVPFYSTTMNGFTNTLSLARYVPKCFFPTPDGDPLATAFNKAQSIGLKYDGSATFNMIDTAIIKIRARVAELLKTPMGQVIVASSSSTASSLQLAIVGGPTLGGPPPQSSPPSAPSPSSYYFSSMSSMSSMSSVSSVSSVSSSSSSSSSSETISAQVQEKLPNAVATVIAEIQSGSLSLGGSGTWTLQEKKATEPSYSTNSPPPPDASSDLPSDASSDLPSDASSDLPPDTSSDSSPTTASNSPPDTSSDSPPTTASNSPPDTSSDSQHAAASSDGGAATSGGNSGLIGGLVGGILAIGLIIGGVALFVFHKKEKAAESADRSNDGNLQHLMSVFAENNFPQELEEELQQQQYQQPEQREQQEQREEQKQQEPEA